MRKEIETARLTVNIPKIRKEKLQAIADEQGLTLTALVIMNLNKIIEKEEIKKSVNNG